MAAAHACLIEGFAQVMIVSDVEWTKRYWEALGFRTDRWGHVERDGVTLLLRQARTPADVRPNHCVEVLPGPHVGETHTYDMHLYLYDNHGVDALYAEFTAGGATIAREIHTTHTPMHWREFAVADPDGYVIMIGAKFAE